MKHVNVQIKIALGSFVAAIVSVICLFVFSIIPLYGLVGNEVIGEGTSHSAHADSVIHRSEVLSRIILPAFACFIIVSVVFLILGLLKASKKHVR